jgi:hypothetical protein
MPGITSEYGLSIIECPVLQVTLGCPLNARYYKWFWVVHHWMPGITSNSGLSIIECPVLQVTLGCPSLNARYYKWLSVVHHWMPGITSDWIVHHWMPGITSNSGLSIIECTVLQVNMGCPSLNAFNDGQPIFTCNTGHSMMDNPYSLVIPCIQWWTTQSYL